MNLIYAYEATDSYLKLPEQMISYICWVVLCSISQFLAFLKRWDCLHTKKL